MQSVHAWETLYELKQHLEVSVLSHYRTGTELRLGTVTKYWHIALKEKEKKIIILVISAADHTIRITFTLEVLHSSKGKISAGLFNVSFKRPVLDS